MNLFRKKQATEPAIPVNKSYAIPGFTKAIKLFGKAQEITFSHKDVGSSSSVT